MVYMKQCQTSWHTVEDAQAAMVTAIDATSLSTDDLVTAAQSTNSSSELNGQTYTEVRTFTDDEYAAYKAGIDSIETGVADELVAAGWEITDTVE